ncbi:MAG TPA: hypothetical protein VGM10_19565 [Actinocrinis sp.]|jgi:hypothetical protein
MTGHDVTGREPARHRAALKPAALEGAVRKPRPTFKTGLVGAIALSAASAAALLVNGCSGGTIHASSAVATAASAIGRAASAAAEPAAQAAVANAEAGASGGANAPDVGASGSASTSAGASAAAASSSGSASAGLGLGTLPDPGTLPQTMVLPSTDDPWFRAGVQALWQAIVHDDPAPAHGFFFPLAAYRQVKAIPDAAGDYRNRLLAWYDLDIKAAHDQLGPDAANAKLVDVQVPAGQAQWITPGTEFNKGSYYRLLGTRLVYQVDGHTASFGIFSLISWRGEWYVVHLGPSTRSATSGIVYQPEG